MSIFFRGQQPQVQRRWYGNGLMDSVIAARIAGTGEVTSDDATSLVAAGAAINLIVNVAGMLPVDEYTGSGSSQREVTPDLVIRDPAGDMVTSQREWIKAYARDIATWGNGVAQKVYDNGRVVAAVLVPPSDVKVVKQGGVKQWFIGQTSVDRRDLVIARLHPRTGHDLSLSPIAQHASTLGLSWHAQRFLAGFYQDGAHPSAVLSTSTPMTAEEAQTLKQRFITALRGREPVVLHSDMKYMPVQMSPVDADLLSSMKWSAAETARIWGPSIPEILGYETGGSMTYANVVDRRQDLLTFAIDPYLVCIEDALSSLVPKPRRVKFNRGALLRADLKTRYEAHQIGIAAGFLTVNEVRELEDLPPLNGATTADPTIGVVQ